MLIRTVAKINWQRSTCNVNLQGHLDRRYFMYLDLLYIPQFARLVIRNCGASSVSAFDQIYDSIPGLRYFRLCSTILYSRLGLHLLTVAQGADQQALLIVPLVCRVAS